MSILNIRRTAAKTDIWVKVFKNGPSKICGRQPLKNLKTIFHKFYLVHSLIH